MRRNTRWLTAALATPPLLLAMGVIEAPIKQDEPELDQMLRLYNNAMAPITRVSYQPRLLGRHVSVPWPVFPRPGSDRYTGLLFLHLGKGTKHA